MNRRLALITLAAVLALGLGATSVRSQGAPGKVAMLLPGDYVSVYVPTTPNPTSIHSGRTWSS